MLKRIVVAAIALVVLAAALPAHAQSHRRRDRNDYEYRGEREPREGWFNYALQNTRNVVTDIMESDARAMTDIERRYPRTSGRRYDRNDRYRAVMPVRRVPLGPYVWGRRYPFDSCGYSWNRNGCRNYQGLRNLIAAGVVTVETERLRREMHELNGNLERADREQELDFIDETYSTRNEPDVVNYNPPQQQPVPQRTEPNNTPKPATLLNMTGCGAHINGEPIAVNGQTTVADRSRRIYVEVDNPTCEKFLENIGEGVIALKCR